MDPQTSLAAEQPAPAPVGREGPLRAAARVWLTALLAGLACGIVVVGVLGRLVMSLIASLNPVATGIRSDDGFVMGQVTLSGSVQLAGSGAQAGAIGAFMYVALRGLMIGPGWFRLVTMSVGPGVVVGALLVHATGVDFTLLQPLWLTIGSFVLLPTVFCAALHLVVEAALDRGGVRSRPLVALGLVGAVATFPLTLALLVGWWGLRELPGHGGRSWTWAAWTLRAVLAAFFLLAVVDLVSDARALSG